MDDVRPASNTSDPSAVSAASWWVDAVRAIPLDTALRFGPPGFERYLRVEFGEEPDGADDGWWPAGAVLDLLAAHSPGVALFVGIWEGWTSHGEVPAGPLLALPETPYLTFRRFVVAPCEAAHLFSAAARLWGRRPEWSVPPHLAWPADRSWFFACDVDEEVEFTVGCSTVVAAALGAAFPERVREVGYGAYVPLEEGDPRERPQTP
ncbi:hypothetical protein [Nocardioides fonticola]